MQLFEVEKKQFRRYPEKKATKVIDVSAIIESYKDEFIDYCAKLKKSGCNSTDKMWWSYRFSEFLKCNEKSKTDEIWLEKTNKYKTWDIFWQKYRNEIIDEQWHHLPFEQCNTNNEPDSYFDY